MRSVSPALAAAIDAPARRVTARVILDGVDISRHVAGVRASRVLAGGLPDEVALPEGIGSARLELELIGDARANLSAAAMWARTTTVGPWAGRERLGRVVTVDIGMWTGTGFEYLRVFTGVSWAVVVAPGGESARLTALDFRDRARTAFAYPPVANYTAGLRPFWPVAFAAHAAGFDPLPSPMRLHPQNPAAGHWTLLYAPMCGSAAPFVAGVNTAATVRFERRVSGSSTPSTGNFPGTVSGPTGILAPALSYTAADVYEGVTGSPAAAMPAGPTPGAVTDLRIEAWVRAADLTGYPSRAVSLGLATSGGGNALLHLGASGFSVTINGDTSTIPGPTLTEMGWTPGSWHLIGVHITRTVNAGATLVYRLDATTRTYSRGTSPAVNLGNGTNTRILSYLPIANIAVSRAPSSAPWLDWRGYTPTARISVPVPQEHAWIGEWGSTSAWEHLADQATASGARVFFDSDGVLRYIGPQAGGATATTVTTTRRVTALAVADSLDHVRNSITVTATLGTGTQLTPAWTYTGDPIEVPAGGTVYVTASWTTPLIETSSTLTVRATPGADNWIYLDANPRPTGAGSPISPALISARLVASAGTIATIAVTSTATTRAWITAPPGGSVAAIGLQGAGVVPYTTTATAEDAASIAAFGRYSYSAPVNGWLQFSAAERAAAILADTARPTARADGVEIVADPRLELGDIVRVVDPHGTGLDVRAYAVGITDTYSTKDGYRQRLDLRTIPT